MIQDFRINLFSAFSVLKFRANYSAYVNTTHKTHDKTYIEDQIFTSLIRLTRATKNKMKISVCQYS